MTFQTIPWPGSQTLRYRARIPMKQSKKPAAPSIWSLIAGAEATPWRQLLIRDHLGPEAQLALFQTCRDGKDVLLGAAQHATMHVTLYTDNQPGPAISMASVQAARNALLTRGNLPTTLKITANTTRLLFVAQDVLGNSTTYLHTLVLDLPPTGDRVPVATVTAFARACPNLRQLSLCPAPTTLPDPADLFPKLLQLDMTVREGNGGDPGILRTTAPYIQQLTGLTLDRSAASEPELAAEYLPLLLHHPGNPNPNPNPNPSNVGAQLRNLQLFAALNDALLGLLLQCAPALTHLKVQSMQLASDHGGVHSATATWEELQVVATMHLSSLARLPRTTAAGMTLFLPLNVVCDVTAPAAAAALAAATARFQQVTVRVAAAQVGLRPPAGLAADDQPAALRAGLGLLRACATAATAAAPRRATLRGWSMTQSLIVELHQGLPAWRELFLVGVEWLPQADMPYACLLKQLPGSFCKVRVGTGGLSSAQIEHICLGHPAKRGHAAALHIQLTNCVNSLVKDLQRKMRLMPVHANVFVSRV